LHQHLVDEGFAEHRRAPGRLDEPSRHEVQIEPGTHAAESAGELRETVNSQHHQGIASPGEGARVTARSLPEAIGALAESATAREWLGEDFVGYFLEMKRAEVDAAATAVTDWEIARYLEAL
jgi:putative glutamine amidotransferase